VRFVVVQVALFVAVGFGPAWFDAGAPATAWRVAAGLLMALGVALGLAAGLHLGRNLTALPVPVADGRLVTNGMYALARHPIYGGVLLAALGWSAFHASWGTFVATLALWGLFEVKVRFEERALRDRYPDYVAYQARTRRFVPFLY
jgi:protein-S-isoprenylcysteine O-methyltransferase Ste14